MALTNTGNFNSICTWCGSRIISRQLGCDCAFIKVRTKAREAQKSEYEEIHKSAIEDLREFSNKLFGKRSV